MLFDVDLVQTAPLSEPDLHCLPRPGPIFHAHQIGQRKCFSNVSHKSEIPISDHD